ncbi:MAG: sugar-binding transcriptional regulator [Bacteroidota bacterium]
MDRQTMIRAARLYYEEDLTQQEIADLLGLSRVTIHALLKKARAEGIVRIQVVTDEPGTEAALAERLKARFGLRHAVVVSCPDGPDDLIQRHLGLAGARLLESLLNDGDTLGCSWGRTLWEVARALKPLHKRINVVQLNGGLGRVLDERSPGELARRLAQIFGGSYYYLHAPGIVENRGIRDALLSDGAIAATMARARSAAVAACGVGSLVRSSLVEFGCLDGHQAEEYLAQGIVGDICLRFFDRDGRIRPTDLDDRVIGLSVEELRAIPCVVGIGGGAAKRDAIRGALLSGLLDICVTDAASASYVLEDT